MKKETRKAKTNWQLIESIYRGIQGHIWFGALYAVLAVAFSFAIPFVVSFTLDSVIQELPFRLPAFLSNWLSSLGGRAFLVQNLWVCGAALLLLTLLNGAFTFLRKREIAYASEGAADTLRKQLYQHLLHVPYDYYKHANTGDLVQRCTSDVDTIRRFISVQLMEVVRTVIMVAIAASVMFSLHWQMALYSMMLMPMLAASSFIYFHFVQKYFTASDEAEGRISSVLQENLTGMRVVRAFAQQHREIEKFTAVNADYRDKTYRLNRLLGLYWGMSDSAGYLQIAVSLCAGIYFVAAGTLTLGNVTLFSTYTAMLTWPVRQLGRILADMGKASVSLNRLDEILSAPEEAEPGLAQRMQITGDVCFKNVCFGYDRPDDVLRDISFTAHPGQTIAILGATGSGKTSLMLLLQRLYSVTSGEITIGGTNINNIDHADLRRGIGIVLQEPFLYSRTIRENIKIIRPDAAEDAMESAARTAAIHDVIASFEKGYDTVVGERGVTLSGGQQQRIAIARTMLQDAPILVFDDSTSAVDSETDAKIRSALVKRRPDGITFLISHRIATLQHADIILVLQDGRIVQQGTHHALLGEEGLYRRIAQIQGYSLEKEVTNI